MTQAVPDPFRVAFVPGVTLGTWLDTWRERMPADPLVATPVEDHDQVAVLREGRAEMCFLRLPVDRDGLHVIPLYDEVPVVVVPLEHVLTVLDEVTVADLADEHVLIGADALPGRRESASVAPLDLPPMSTRQAVEVVASGTGVVVVPRSVARLHHRKDVTTRPVVDGLGSQVGLAWRTDLDDPRVDTFVGIVRGRTARSTRGVPPEAPRPTTQKEKKKTAAPRRARPVPGKSGRTPLARRRRPR